MAYVWITLSTKRRRDMLLVDYIKTVLRGKITLGIAF